MPFMIIIMAILVGAGVMIILNGKKSAKERVAKKQRTYRKVHRFLSQFFLTSSKMQKISSQLQNMSVYSREEINELSTKYYLMSTGVTVGMIAAGFVLFKDMVAVIICCFFALLVSNILVDKQIDKTNYIVYRQLSNALAAVRQEYLKTDSVTEAIGNADVGQAMRKPFEEIYNILTQANGELKLHEFYETMPFRPLQTLASICYNINNAGDTKDESGQSNFVQALTLMSSDVNSELKRMQIQKSRFGQIEFLPFVPVVGIPICEAFFSSIMPGTALIYNGPSGYIIRVAILLVSMLAYTVISRINSVVPIKEDDRAPWVYKMLKIPAWKRFIRNITPKNAAAVKANRQIKSSLSRIDLDEMYTKKVIYGIIAFILAIIAILSAIQLGEEFIYNSTQQLSLTASNEMDEYSTAAIKELDKKYIESGGNYSETDLNNLIKGYMPGLTDLELQDQVKRLQDKMESLNDCYFKWWYMLLAIAMSFVGFMIPNITLKARGILVRTEAEDDFLQLQTLVLILMNTDSDTLDCLQQLCQNSRVHKNMLLYCYHSFPSNPEKELTRLKAQTPLLEFKRFIGKLELTVSDLSLREAFGDLMIDREYMLSSREIAMNATINKKRGLCGPLSMLPMGLFVVGELLIPLGILGFREFSKALNMM